MAQNPFADPLRNRTPVIPGNAPLPPERPPELGPSLTDNPTSTLSHITGGQILAGLRKAAPKFMAGMSGGGGGKSPTIDPWQAFSNGLSSGIQGVSDYERAMAIPERQNQKDERQSQIEARQDQRQQKSDDREERRLDLQTQMANQGKPRDPLADETSRTNIWSTDPLRTRLEADDAETIPSRKLPPDQRAALEQRAAERRAQIWSMGAAGPDAAPAQPMPQPMSQPRPQPMGAEPAAPQQPAVASPAPAAPQQTAPATPKRARNPQTGEVIEWDPAGKKWLTVVPGNFGIPSP